ncbi:tRNA (adenosine(37)-N6)-threonylcarbamoyltransferase complex transferase subunit TsaD [Pseudobdellovibrio exovorus]|uniref:tRNA N6-adenosine threonylcarbamoyltransferase n=1 Tax=Pseudobdellovibrio exovorus JSS TaxID=1184267 RepID=M4VA52_9BACT|nr:tRNA (adenosine(37)-N6)-threonylcarbamoyltransferase complex transferase subunit TsaD [Pseudobdellovibrio exovorus]AGH96282.1 O-sialoglycoprotein endopeptidase [Pseudobdellovibrio exovorus JSS]
MNQIRRVLSVETSCDDTSVAIVDDQGYVIRQVSANQDLEHAPYGGIVPEIASRNHSVALLPLIQHVLDKSELSWKDIEGLVVTNRPGLIGSLIVGIMTLKSISQSYGIPLIGVNHLEGHLLAPFLKDDSYAPPADFNYPYIALAVSGGHSSLYWVKSFSEYTVIGSTKDDAAGEAFDKFAKMIGLGYPGGVQVDKCAQQGDPQKYQFPRSLVNEDNLMMSFSGLKSSAHRLLQTMTQEQIEHERDHLCASFQEAIVDVLISKATKAAARYQCNRLVITGGVSANSRLRARAQALEPKYQVVIPPLRYCTDNAAMIGYTGILRLNRGERNDLSMGPSPQLYENDFSYDLQ